MAALNQLELDDYFRRFWPLLLDIFKGKHNSERRKKYLALAPSERHTFPNDIKFSSQTFEYLLKKMKQKAKNPTELSFFEKVLLPELHLQICMDVMGLTYAEAEKFLQYNNDAVGMFLTA